MAMDGGRIRHLDPAIFGHRQRITITDDEMVEHPHIDQLHRLLQTLGQHPVGRARLGVSRGVVMAQDQRRRVVCQGALDHLARMHAGGVDRAAKEDFECQDPMPGIEEQTGKHLMGLMPQHGLEVVAHLDRTLEYGCLAQVLGQMPTRHLQHRLQLGEFRRPQPQLADKRLLVRLQQVTQAAKLLQQVPGQVHRAFPGDPGAQKDRQQFGVGQTRRTLLQKFLPRPLCRRPISNAHSTSLSMGAAVP